MSITRDVEVQRDFSEIDDRKKELGEQQNNRNLPCQKTEIVCY